MVLMAAVLAQWPVRDALAGLLASYHQQSKT
jgi:hypothetical protein